MYAGEKFVGWRLVLSMCILAAVAVELPTTFELVMTVILFFWCGKNKERFNFIRFEKCRKNIKILDLNLGLYQNDQTYELTNEI